MGVRQHVVNDGRGTGPQTTSTSVSPPRNLRPLSPASYVEEPSVVGVKTLAEEEWVDRQAVLHGVTISDRLVDADKELARRHKLPGGYFAPARHLIQLRDAWIDTSTGLVCSERGSYLPDTVRSDALLRSRHYAVLGGGVLRRPHLPAIELQTDKTCLLVGLDARGNYFHWLFEALVRPLYAGGDVPDDCLVLTPPINAMEHELLTTAGVRRELIAELPGTSLVKVKDLFVPPRGVDRSAIAPTAAQALRALAPREASPRARLFISRARAPKRRIVKEQRLYDVLKHHGIEVVQSERLSFRDQIRLYSSASAIVAPHGAGLANLAFCPPHTRVIEIQPPHFPRTRRTLYWNLSACRSLRYTQFVCSSVRRDRLLAPRRPAHNHGVFVDPGELDAVLEQCL